MFKKIIGSIFLLFTIVSASQAQITIDITSGVDSAKPIAVMPFTAVGGNVPQDVSEIIASDLRNSGKFSPLNSSQLPQRVQNPNEIQASSWLGLGVDAIIMGQIQPVGDGRYQITYQLVDIASGTPSIILQNQQQIQTQWIRYGAHAISDEVFEKLTGIKGAFRTRIAYIVKTGTSQYAHELRVSDYDGFNQTTIHRSPEPLMSPAWSVDGTKIAFVTFEGGRSSLVMQNTQTGAIEKIASFPRHNGAPAFSPDGRKLAFALSQTGSLNIYVMDLASKQIRQVTNDRSNNTEPAWFPDSQTLAFTSDQTGRPQVYKVGINGGSAQRLTWEGAQNQNAQVSPDGQSLIYVSSASGQQNIVKQDLNTNSLTVLTNSNLAESPSVAPNGTMVIYSTSSGYNTGLGLVSTDGRFTARLPTTEGQVKYPSWSPFLTR